MSDDWAGILNQGEHIVWQGAPSTRVRFEWQSAMMPFFFLFFTGFSVFWMMAAAQAGGYFWTFGLLFFSTGMYNLVGVHFWNAYSRKFTHYTLTNKRAFIGTSIFGRKKLESYPITADTTLTYEEDRTDGSVLFASVEKRRKNGTYLVPIGFKYIPDAREVLQTMSQVQQGTLDAE